VLHETRRHLRWSYHHFLFIEVNTINPSSTEMPSCSHEAAFHAVRPPNNVYAIRAESIGQRILGLLH
jgi:hypothetical protein